MELQGVWIRGRPCNSVRNASMSIDLIGLKETVFVGHLGGQMLSVHLMREWSEIHKPSSTSVDLIISSELRERTKSRVCPLLCVG